MKVIFIFFVLISGTVMATDQDFRERRNELAEDRKEDVIFYSNMDQVVANWLGYERQLYGEISKNGFVTLSHLAARYYPMIISGLKRRDLMMLEACSALEAKNIQDVLGLIFVAQGLVFELSFETYRRSYESLIEADQEALRSVMGEIGIPIYLPTVGEKAGRTLANEFPAIARKYAKKECMKYSGFVPSEYEVVIEVIQQNGITSTRETVRQQQKVLLAPRFFGVT